MSNLTPKQERFVAEVNCFYVYELIDPRTDVVFYVGKGKGRRVLQHEKDAKAGRVVNPDKTMRIRDIIRSGHTVQHRIVASSLSEREAFRIERQTIASYGIANLTNITPGSETAADRAVALLRMVKPFDQWVAENPTGLDGKPADPKWYHLVVEGLRREAGIEVVS